MWLVAATLDHRFLEQPMFTLFITLITQDCSSALLAYLLLDYKPPEGREHLHLCYILGTWYRAYMFVECI